MRVELTRQGYIKIIAEDYLEAWALNGIWPIDKMDRNKNEDRLMVDCSVLDSSIPEFEGQTAGEITSNLTIRG